VSSSSVFHLLPQTFGLPDKIFPPYYLDLSYSNVMFPENPRKTVTIFKEKALFPNAMFKRMPGDDDKRERIFRLDIENGWKKEKDRS